MEQNMVNLEKFAGGALAEQLNIELERVINNIYDPNTDYTKARKVTCTITFKPNNKRNAAQVSIQTKSTLVPVMPTETNIFIDRDIKTGKVLAAEIGNQIVGQVEMDIKEPIPESEDANVIDLKKINNK